MDGSPNPCWDIAPTGQIGIIGQRWFCGQRSLSIVSAIAPLFVEQYLVDGFLQLRLGQGALRDLWFAVAGDEQ